jgi:hypothetical protein
VPGSPRKRARRERVEKGEIVPNASRNGSKLGKPGAFDAVKAEKIVAYVKAGNYLETAAAAAGVGRDQMRRWLHDGARKPASPEGQFAAAVEQARAEAEVRSVALIESHGRPATRTREKFDAKGQTVERTTETDRGDWRPLAWRLERMNPAKFAARVRLEVENELGAVLDALESELPRETYATILGIIDRRLGAGAPSIPAIEE